MYNIGCTNLTHEASQADMLDTTEMSYIYCLY